MNPFAQPLRLCALALGLACTPIAGWAEKADRSQPMNVVADALKYDDLKQVSEFSGHVILTKGTLTIRADKVLVRQDPQGFQYGTATATPGQRAFFRQKREKADEWIEGEAELLVYDGKADRVQFTTNAVIRRYQGATLLDESTGHSVTYDNTTDQFTVDGQKQAGGVTTQRVRTILAPRNQVEAPTTEATTQSTNPLKTSPSLTGKTQ